MGPVLVEAAQVREASRRVAEEFSQLQSVV